MVKEVLDLNDTKAEAKYQKDLKKSQKGLMKQFKDKGYDVIHIGKTSQDITDKIKISDLAIKKTLGMDSVTDVRSYKVGEVYNVTLKVKGKPEIQGNGSAATYDKALERAEIGFPSRSKKGRMETVRLIETFKFPTPELEKIVKTSKPPGAVAGSEYVKNDYDICSF